jgi:hypothetical protein
MEIRTSDEDVLKYIDNQMPRLLRRRIVHHPDLQELVKKQVLNAVDGMCLFHFHCRKGRG